MASRFMRFAIPLRRELSATPNVGVVGQYEDILTKALDAKAFDLHAKTPMNARGTIICCAVPGG